MANGEAQSSPIATGKGGAVDLNSPFFRKLETDRGLPSGVISAMAEKESGGNTFIRARDPNSSAGGLFQINNATAREWGLSGADRFDPVKASTAVADVLARRANQYGIERAVGMHYGGVGSPWDQPVGSCGLSPASYSGDVFNRAQKYAGDQSQYASVEPTRVGFPSPAPQEGVVGGRAIGQLFTAPSAPAPPPEYHEAPYLMQMPDGSVESRVLRTDQPVTHRWIAGYVAQQGGTYLGPPPPTEPAPQPEQPPPPPEAPSPFVGPIPPMPPESERILYDPAIQAQWAAERARTAPSPMPSAPGPSPVPPPTPSLTQAFGGYDLGGGAPLSYALAPPAPAAVAPQPPAPTPPTATSARDVYFPQRGIRTQIPEIMGSTVFGVTGGGLAAPLGPEVAIPAAMGSAGLGGMIGEGTTILGEKITGSPPAEPGTARQRLANAFTRSATFEGATRALTYPAALVASRVMPAARATEEVLPVLRETPSLATMQPSEIVAKWQALGPEGQRALAGDQLPAYQTIMDTVAKGEKPWGKLWPGVSAYGVVQSILSGHPLAALSSMLPAGWALARQGGSKAASAAIRNPAIQPWFAMLPRAAQVAEPMISVPLRAGMQTVGAQPQAFPPAEAFPLFGPSE